MRREAIDLIKRARYAWGYAKAPVVLAVTTGHVPPGALVIGRTPAITNRGRMIFGRGIRLRGHVQRSAFSTGDHGVLVVGDDCFFNEGVHVHAERSITVGDRVDVGDGVRIYDTNFHPARPGGRTRVAPVVIEDDVWLGVEALVLPGVRIGRGAVIGARVVVTQDVEPGAVVVPPEPVVRTTYAVPQDFRRRSGAMAWERP